MGKSGQSLPPLSGLASSAIPLANLFSIPLAHKSRFETFQPGKHDVLQPVSLLLRRPGLLLAPCITRTQKFRNG